MVIIEDIYITSEEIAKQADKHFLIAKASRIEEMRQQDGKIVKKLIVPVKLVDGTVREWIPNRTSKKKLVQMHGPDTDKWIGKTEEFVLREQDVMGVTKNVIFVK